MAPAKMTNGSGCLSMEGAEGRRMAAGEPGGPKGVWAWDWGPKLAETRSSGTPMRRAEQNGWKLWNGRNAETGRWIGQFDGSTGTKNEHLLGRR